jgi:hypothetical protein
MLASQVSFIQFHPTPSIKTQNFCVWPQYRKTQVPCPTVASSFHLPVTYLVGGISLPPYSKHGKFKAGLCLFQVGGE